MAANTDHLQTFLNHSVPLEQENIGTPYLDIQAHYAAQNRMLRACLALVAIGTIAASAAVWKLANREPERLVVRVDSTGQPTVAPYASLTYQPREPEIRYFLMNFVKDHYSRLRANYRDSFQRKLFFLSSELSNAAMAEERRTNGIQTFLSGSADEVEAFVTNVSLEQLSQPPYKAIVMFDTIHRTPDGYEKRREKHMAQFTFRLLDQIPDTFVQRNPLGLVITAHHEDKGF